MWKYKTNNGWKKEIKSGDSYTTYKFRLPTIPTDKKVTIEINNDSANQEQVILDTDILTTPSNAAVQLTVADDGTVEVPICYALAPTNSSTSTFGVTFKYNNEKETQTVSGLKFDYNVDYDTDLKDGEWESKVTPAESSHWNGKDIVNVYMEDVVKNPAIFQSDARYSTSKMIKDAINNKQIENLKSFRAYFNNIIKDSYGLNVQMNYEVKSDNNGKFEFIQLGQGSGQGKIKYSFANFDLSCNFSTINGYKFNWDTSKKCFNLKDETKKYDLIGRMKGKFDAVVSYDEKGTESWKEEYNKQNVEFDGVLQLPDTTKFEWTNDRVAFMFAFGIIHLTYNFDWATPEPNLKVLSSYAKNA